MTIEWIASQQQVKAFKSDCFSPSYLHTSIPHTSIPLEMCYIMNSIRNPPMHDYFSPTVTNCKNMTQVQGKTTDHRLRSRLWWRSASTSFPTLIASRWRAYSGDFTLDKDNKKRKTLKNKEKDFLPTFNKWSWQIKNRRSANAAVVRELQTKIDQGENVDFEIQVRVPNQWHHHHHHYFFLKLKSLFWAFFPNQ